MDIVLISLGFIALIIGFMGSILPILPGAPVSWLGILFIHFSSYAQFSTKFLIVSAIITIFLTLLDFLLPTYLTKKFGGSKKAQTGATVGTLFGLFMGPVGLVFGPLIGAFIGEFINDSSDISKVVKVAFSSFIGFLLSTGMKLIWCVYLIWRGIEVFI